MPSRVRVAWSRRKSSAKKPSKKVTKRPLARAKAKSHKKLPGFNAFHAQSAPRVKKNGQKFVVCREVTPPETGIHSLEWAAAIVPQLCGFLRLPFEVRRQIYELAIADFISGYPMIEPRKKGNKFFSPKWRNAAQETAALYLLCRQIYVDVVGSGLLYSAKMFVFDSPTLMLNYLWVINPVHKDAVRSIKLQIVFRAGKKTLPSKALELLAGCKGLRNLALHLDVDDLTSERVTVVGMYRGYQVSDKLLRNIREWEALREIKGLMSFDLHFSKTYFYRWAPGAEDRCRQLEKDLRDDLLKG
ncbi:hypothetical protein V8E51_009722 [Hyaloscypha variabilis]